MSSQRTRSRRFSTEIRSFTICDREITFALQRSIRRRRTVQLQVDPETGFKLLVPHTLTDREIEEFLLNRADWILKHKSDFAEPTFQRDWATDGTMMFRGTSVDYLVRERDHEDQGKDLPATVTKSLEGDTILVTIPPGAAGDQKSRYVRELLENWYRQEAWDHLKKRVDEYGNLMGVKPRQLKLSNAKKRWGSCSGKQSINLNWRLIMIEDSLIDYVVVHELAHLVELNHSADFWRVVGGVFPDHRELRRRLREQSPSAFG